MEIFIKAENYQVWRVVEICDFEVTKKNEKGESFPKPLSKYDKEDFDKMEMKNPAKKILHHGSLLTHELHLGTHDADPSRPKDLALKSEEQDDSKTDDEEVALIVKKFKKFFNRNYKGKSARKPSKLSYHKCGSPDHFIKECPFRENDKEKGKYKEKGKEQQKAFLKTEMRRAMVAALGDSTLTRNMPDQPEEETAHLCLMAKTDDEEDLPNNKICTKIPDGTRKGNIYVVDLNLVPRNNLTCLSAIEDEPLLWHKRYGHASMSLLNKLSGKELIVGLPTIKVTNHEVCGACVKGNQVRSSSFKTKKISTQSPLELIRMDLCGPV
ncbi:uncharacterized protein LOC125494796 [Beta vulgaris subsp. vulgaris]|uniref:uncharacterized protein LOC125494796 n=1 Tax=Beta vulgaris subsp. vulgaris TaxID=3555 RepID=UPI0020373376|nr:uncharacterized protein LOC125494796 [Beta vulgaris subsp. vulgaris]